MSYCRFSTDDFQCDLYCYADVSGGYTTHVAANRLVFKEPLPPFEPFDSEHLDAWMARQRKIDVMVQKAERVPLGLPFDDQTFQDESLDALKSRLLMLREAGYRFPDYVIETIEMEIAEDQLTEVAA